jgi:toxin secretion/phage lysis holin
MLDSIKFLCDSVTTITGGKMIATGFLALITLLFGANLGLLLALVILIGIDALTGIARAIKNKEFSSNKMRKGISKTTGYMLAIVLGHQIGCHIAPTLLFWIPIALYAWLSIVELESVSENLNDLGIPFPSLKDLWKLWKKFKKEAE